MRDVRFEKYSVYGNNFILVDETTQPALREHQIAWLAGLVKDPVMGMACEGLILLQKNSKTALEQIYGRTDFPREQLNHWLKAEYLFRYYEEECLEGLSCGNALLSLGAYLRREHRIPEATILIEIPSGSPAVCSISTPDNDGFTLFDAGRPGPVGPAIFQGMAAPTDSGLQGLEQYRLNFSGQVDLPAEVATEVQLSGYFAAVGEPHLVFFYDDSTPVRKALFDLLLDEPRPATTPADQLRREQGDRLFHRIGAALNADPRFPIGINVNAARVTGGKTLLYRTFERQGINRETCACGTGALASAHIARRLNLIDTPPGDYLRIVPRKINMLRPPGDYFYQARYTDDDRWQLKAKPSLVCKGVIPVPA